MEGLSQTLRVILVLGIFGRLSMANTIVSVRFDRYENPGGKGDNGNCCDGVGFICNGQCDHYFEFCVDFPNSTIKRMDVCPMGGFVTDSVRERNSITFGNTIGAAPNPVMMNVTGAWVDGAFFKINVWDADSRNDNDLVEKLKLSMYFMADGEVHEMQPDSRKMGGITRTTLTLSISATCAEDWYGPQCDVPCHEGPHHSCDPATGQMVCHTGWTGSECSEDIDECQTAPCLNDSTCRNTEGSFLCECLPGHAGPLCDRPAESCAESPCHNSATCEDVYSSKTPYVCHCFAGYTGWLCDVPVSPCDEDPCRNGGHCVLSGDGYECACEPGWTGQDCGEVIDGCRGDPCGTNGNCEDLVEGFVCLCQAGWTGARCESNIDNCAGNRCADGSTCSNLGDVYTCVCPPGREGEYCNESRCDLVCHNDGECVHGDEGPLCVCTMEYEGPGCTNFRRCNEQPCLNNGTCASRPSSEHWCDCLQGFSGRQCEETPACEGGHCSITCAETNCENEGECMADGRCSCPWYSFGVRCQNRLPDCKGMRQRDQPPHLMCAASVCWPFSLGETGKHNKVVQCFLTEPCSCTNGGSCHSRGLGALCLCPPGFKGRDCQEATGNGYVSLVFDTWLPGDEIQAFVLAIHSSSTKVLEQPRANISVSLLQYMCEDKGHTYTALEIDIFQGREILGADEMRLVLDNVHKSLLADKTYTDSDDFRIEDLNSHHCERTDLTRASRGQGRGTNLSLNVVYLVVGVGVLALLVVIIGVAYWRYKRQTTYVIKRNLSKKDLEKRLSQRPVLYEPVDASASKRYSNPTFESTRMDKVC